MGDAVRGLAQRALRALRAALDDHDGLGAHDVALEAARVLHMLGVGEELRLVDLRADLDALRDGEIEGAERIHPDALGAVAGEADRDVVLVCVDGVASARAALALRRAGHGRFWSVDRGFPAWARDGGGVIRPAGALA